MSSSMYIKRNHTLTKVFHFYCRVFCCRRHIAFDSAKDPDSTGGARISCLEQLCMCLLWRCSSKRLTDPRGMYALANHIGPGSWRASDATHAHTIMSFLAQHRAEQILQRHALDRVPCSSGGNFSFRILFDFLFSILCFSFFSLFGLQLVLSRRLPLMLPSFFPFTLPFMDEK